MQNIAEIEKGRREVLQLISFEVGEEEFGVDILKVQEINRVMNITKVANAPEFVEGVVNLRGRIIPVICLRNRLNMLKKEFDDSSRIIVVDLDGKTIGFIVDEVNEVLRLPKSITETPSEAVSGINSDFITAVGKLDSRPLILLDFEKIFSSKEEVMFETVN